VGAENSDVEGRGGLRIELETSFVVRYRGSGAADDPHGRAAHRLAGGVHEPVRRRNDRKQDRE
jgi:hypothetical protein